MRFPPFILLNCCLTLISANPDLTHLKAGEIYRIHKFEDLKVNELKKYPVIFVDEDKSIILASFIRDAMYKPKSVKDWRTVLDPSKLSEKLMGNKKFLHIQYDQYIVKKSEPESFFLDGCFDNSLSETPSIVARTFSRALTARGSIMINWYVQVYVVGTGLDIGVSHVHDEKIACTVKPRGKLQIEVTQNFREMVLKRQRDIAIEHSLLKAPRLQFGMWTEIDGPSKLDLRMQIMACVTDEKLLCC